jgi:FkbM family methyltransferase
MSQSPPAPGASETPAGESPGSPAAGGAHRRALLLGGLAGGVAGAAGGTAAARWLFPPPPPERVEVEKKHPTGTKLSYAQFGEDLVASSLFYSIAMDRPTYVDIGAGEPIDSNNTYLFYLRGARGLLVEPNVDLAEMTRAERPGDKLLVAGVGVDAATEADYYVMTAPQLNTFDKEQAERLARDTAHKIARVVKMPLIDINKAIGDHFGTASPDFLSIDVEGLEFAILEKLDLKRFRPKVICVDTLVTGTLAQNPKSTAYLTARGYEVRGMTYPNTLYMDKALLKEKK